MIAGSNKRTKVVIIQKRLKGTTEQLREIRTYVTPLDGEGPGPWVCFDSKGGVLADSLCSPE